MAMLKVQHPTNNTPRNISRLSNPVLNAVNDDMVDMSRSAQPYPGGGPLGGRGSVISGSGGISQYDSQLETVHSVLGPGFMCTISLIDVNDWVQDFQRPSSSIYQDVDT